MYAFAIDDENKQTQLVASTSSETKSNSEFSNINPKPDKNMVVDQKMMKGHSSNKDDVSKIS